MNPKLRSALEGETAALRAWLEQEERQLRHPDAPVLGRLDTPEDMLRTGAGHW
ncbi:hypothetical protein [Deinococcus geothermalis]|uniref:hypothetical protein n=1 Tax=Deinococcus geothermalis TaxID=68909 RepID=UPI0002F4E3BA|nr:hypothetical protein [Deinococcus geothermalis]